MAITKVSNSGIKSGMTKYDSFLAGNAAYDPGSYWLIERVTVGSGGASSITFSSIPSTYKHLQIRGIVRGSQSTADNWLTIQANNVSRYHSLKGDGSSVYAETGASNWFSDIVGNTSTANVFGAIIIDILDYANTNKYKTLRALSGYDANGSGIVSLTSALDVSTSAISTLTIAWRDGYNLAQYSSFALYGIKG